MEKFEKELIINEQIEHTFHRIRIIILLYESCEICVEESVVPQDLLGEETAYLKALSKLL